MGHQGAGHPLVQTVPGSRGDRSAATTEAPDEEQARRRRPAYPSHAWSLTQSMSTTRSTPCLWPSTGRIAWKCTSG
eukprot:3755574-Pyramimonas_sp.AAC.1